VVVYDDTGGSMAVRLWWLLRWMDHGSVALLDGGWQAWTGDCLPVSDRTPPAAQEAAFSAWLHGGMLLTTEQVESDLHTREWLLLDARTAERFRGEHEPIDPVSGHIPGARSHPLQRNLADDGRFLAPEALRVAYAATIGDHRPDRLACLCGSGVTACHDVLALELAGYGLPRLYAGSWSEWIRDPDRPVAVGPD
jgi:thiosulfate/3-mercaptopyruvate sulfurtransferase